MGIELQIEKAKNVLNAHLGNGSYHKNGEASFYCPNCNHYKKKLQINLATQAYHCWVCNMRGRGLYSLFRKTKASSNLTDIAKEISVSDSIQQEKETFDKQLPAEFRPLHINFGSPDYKNALHYVINKRGLTPLDVLRYNVGYCEEGEYSGMIIIPSYDANNQLNYFVGRSYYDGAFMKHKNPTWSKDVVGFENQISFKQPLVLVEGAFDAISTKRNTIPLFGKKILPKLKQSIIDNKVPKLYISLDKDAVTDALEELEYFLNQGIEVYYVDLVGKDPNELGFNKMIELINSCKVFTFGDLVRYKLFA